MRRREPRIVELCPRCRLDFEERLAAELRPLCGGFYENYGNGGALEDAVMGDGTRVIVLEI
jgi:hypothetical protein